MNFSKDRIIQGFIAGIAGWLPTFIFSTAIYFGLHLLKLRFMDFAGLLAFNHKPHGLPESLFSELIVLGQMGVYGILFAFITKVIASPHPILKGGLYGGFMWFITYSLANFFKVKGIHGIVDFNTAFINLTASVIWGITLGGIFLVLDRQYRLKNEQ
jgi:hypothetical protein